MSSPPAIPAKPRRFGNIYKKSEDVAVAPSPETLETPEKTVESVEKPVEIVEKVENVNASPVNEEEKVIVPSPTSKDTPDEVVESHEEKFEKVEEKPDEQSQEKTEERVEPSPPVRKPPPGAVPMFGMTSAFKLPSKPSLARSDSMKSESGEVETPKSPPKPPPKPPTRTPSVKSQVSIKEPVESISREISIKEEAESELKKEVPKSPTRESSTKESPIKESPTKESPQLREPKQPSSNRVSWTPASLAAETLATPTEKLSRSISTPIKRTEKYPTDVQALQALLKEKDEEIEKLKARIKELEANAKPDWTSVKPTTTLSHVSSKDLKSNLYKPTKDRIAIRPGRTRKVVKEEVKIEPVEVKEESKESEVQEEKIEEKVEENSEDKIEEKKEEKPAEKSEKESEEAEKEEPETPKPVDPLSRIKMAGGVNMFGMAAPPDLSKLSIKEEEVPEESTTPTTTSPVLTKKPPPPIPSKATLSRTLSATSSITQEEDDSVVTGWVADMSHCPMPEDGDVWNWLQDGTVLCKVINTLLEPKGKKVKINAGKFPQQQLDNIATYIHSASELGVSYPSFEPEDLRLKKIPLERILSNLKALKKATSH